MFGLVEELQKDGAIINFLFGTIAKYGAISKLLDNVWTRWSVKTDIAISKFLFGALAKDGAIYTL